MELQLLFLHIVLSGKMPDGHGREADREHVKYACLQHACGVVK